MSLQDEEDSRKFAGAMLSFSLKRASILQPGNLDSSKYD
jgi:hypothetical protein